MNFPLPPLEPPQWATHIIDRHPKFKIHQTLGHAKTALMQSGYNYRCVRGGTIYRFVDGEWREIITIERQAPKQEAKEQLKKVSK